MPSQPDDNVLLCQSKHELKDSHMAEWLKHKAHEDLGSNPSSENRKHFLYEILSELIADNYLTL